MNKGVPSVSSTEISAASGILGAGIGCVLAPRKYCLEELIIQSPDTFERSLNRNRLLKSDGDTINAYKTLEKARNKYIKAVENNNGESALIELKRATNIKNAYKSIRKFIPKARTTYSIIGALTGILLTSIISIIDKTRN